MTKPNPFDPGYYTEHDLAGLGFRAVGRDVRIARQCTIVGLPFISLGDHVRIDSQCVIVAGEHGSIEIGSHVHVATACLLSGGDGITLEDFSGLSSGVRLYSRTDDYSGQYLTNPTVPERFTGVTRGRVTLARHGIIGSGSVVMPGVHIGEGSAVGALSLVTKSLEPWGVYFGAPARRLKARSQRLLDLESELRAAERSGASNP